ncbi:hypothetical protein AVEN_61988-1 [Araneus ventricosus]|uniref:Uncharacterized protein n=1 Tax=Araneus ventricosus TaxID=182803 RepID=A0A4Y2L0I3_ARAVE|nr:hypothetical protein AVEN_61988-1 [Araneus ventricosus]
MKFHQHRKEFHPPRCSMSATASSSTLGRQSFRVRSSRVWSFGDTVDRRTRAPGSTQPVPPSGPISSSWTPRFVREVCQKRASRVSHPGKVTPQDVCVRARRTASGVFFLSAYLDLEFNTGNG